VLAEELEGQRRILQHAAAHGLHGDKADALLPAERDQSLRGLAGDIVERKHQGFKQVHACHLDRQIEAVRGHADVPDAPLGFGLQGDLVRPAGRQHLVQRLLSRDVVELKDVYVLDAQTAKTQLHLLAEGFGLPCGALGGQYQPIAPAGDRLADALLAGAIAVGRVQEGDPEVHTAGHYRHGFLFGQALDRDTSKGNLGYRQSCTTQGYLSHGSAPSRIDVDTTSRTVHKKRRTVYAHAPVCDQ